MLDCNSSLPTCGNNMEGDNLKDVKIKRGNSFEKRNLLTRTQPGTRKEHESRDPPEINTVISDDEETSNQIYTAKARSESSATTITDLIKSTRAESG